MNGKSPGQNKESTIASADRVKFANFERQKPESRNLLKQGSRYEYLTYGMI